MIGANTPQPSIPAISIFPKSVWPSVAWREPVCWLILREILLLAAAGIAIGLPCALAASRLVASLLYGVSASGPLHKDSDRHSRFHADIQPPPRYNAFAAQSSVIPVPYGGACGRSA